jgi:hypothetical protein
MSCWSDLPEHDAGPQRELSMLPLDWSNNQFDMSQVTVATEGT